MIQTGLWNVFGGILRGICAIYACASSIYNGKMALKESKFGRSEYLLVRSLSVYTVCALFFEPSTASSFIKRNFAHHLPPSPSSFSRLWHQSLYPKVACSYPRDPILLCLFHGPPRHVHA